MIRRQMAGKCGQSTFSYLCFFTLDCKQFWPIKYAALHGGIKGHGFIARKSNSN